MRAGVANGAEDHGGLAFGAKGETVGGGGDGWLVAERLEQIITQVG